MEVSDQDHVAHKPSDVKYSERQDRRVHETRFQVAARKQLIQKNGDDDEADGCAVGQETRN